MIAAAVLTALALVAQRGDVVARLVPEPAEVEIGEPVEWVLDVVHPASARVRPLDKSLAVAAKPATTTPASHGAQPTTPSAVPADDAKSAAAERAWVKVGDTTWTRTTDPADPTRVHTNARFRAIALEGGDLAAPAMAIELVDGANASELAPESLPVHVRGALAEGEDAPRPMLGFRDVPADLGPVKRGPWVLAALVAVVVAALATWLLARKKKAPAPAPPTPIARLDELARAFASDVADGRATVYALSRLVRETVDAFVASDRSGATDDAWSAAVATDERVPLGVRDASTRLLASAERVKYAQETPTRFAVEELVKDARAALETLASTPRPVEGAPTSAKEARAA